MALSVMWPPCESGRRDAPLTAPAWSPSPLIGRASHAEGVDLAGVRAVPPGRSWPAAAVGTLLGRTWRRPRALRSGVAVWVGTLVGGMLLRALTGGGVRCRS